MASRTVLGLFFGLLVGACAGERSQFDSPSGTGEPDADTTTSGQGDAGDENRDEDADDDSDDTDDDTTDGSDVTRDAGRKTDDDEPTTASDDDEPTSSEQPVVEAGSDEPTSSEQPVVEAGSDETTTEPNEADSSTGVDTECGDGELQAPEECDDGNTENGDGCNTGCRGEDGWDCDAEAAKCTAVCGDGQVLGDETCDDDNTDPEDGCDDECQTEVGWACSDEPSECAETCGNGAIDEGETCDDEGVDPDDGCSPSCQVESGYACSEEPSVCAQTCGNGEIDDGETCDDGELEPGDGCSPTCALEDGWECDQAPSSCETVCGDGQLAGDEECDDDGTAPNDGCSATCSIEANWTCENEPSDCTPVCGNGELDADEECDDENATDADGCTACQIDEAWECSGEPSDCEAIAAPQITAFTTSLDSVPGGGGEVLLAWSVTGADSLRIDADGMNDLGVVTGNLLEVEVTGDVSFTLVAENEGGTTEETVNVEVNSIGESVWSDQWGTTAADYAFDVEVASDGSIYVVGQTDGNIDGNNAGAPDAFLTKYNSSGTAQWTKRLGSSYADVARSVAVDGNGNVYLAGSTKGALQSGSSNADTMNCFYAKYNSSGGFQWAYQYAGNDCELAVSGDALYVANGSTSGVTLKKFPLTGLTAAWSRTVNFAQGNDIVTGVAADSNGAYVIGNSFDEMGGGPATSFGYTSAGTSLWDDEWSGTSYIYTGGAAVHGGTLFMSASAYGGQDFPDSAGLTDPIVSLFSTSNGARSDGVQLGTSDHDYGQDVAVDPRGNVIVVGAAAGSLSAGESGQYFAAKRTQANSALWTSQWGPSSASGQPSGVAVAPNGMVIVVGWTDAELESDPPGGYDAFIRAFK